MSSIFSKIIAGEIPSYKIYEDEHTYAFLDIHPETAGHVLVVPKVEVDKVYDLQDSDWLALWAAVKKIALHMETALDARILMKVIGTDVPHAHVHLMPFDATWKHGRVLELSDDEFKSIAAKLSID
ncbi:MAG: HIT family protein [Candidatus Saccharimonadales bacterium]